MTGGFNCTHALVYVDVDEDVNQRSSMKFAKIRFETRAERVKAVEALMHRAKVVALKGGIFIVPDLALDWLKTQKIAYALLEKMN